VYNSIKDHGYDHIVVPHIHGFGHGENTTNGIESCWSEIKNTNQTVSRLNKDEDLVQELIHIMKLYYA